MTCLLFIAEMASTFALAKYATKVILASLFGPIPDTPDDMVALVGYGIVFAVTSSLYTQNLAS